MKSIASKPRWLATSCSLLLAGTLAAASTMTSALGVRDVVLPVLPKDSEGQIFKNLKKVGEYKTYRDDVLVLGDLTTARTNTDTEKFGNYLYIASSNTPCESEAPPLNLDSGTIILDISDPKNITRVGRVAPPSNSSHASIDVESTPAGDLMVVSVDGFCGFNLNETFGTNQTEIYDVSDRTNPTLISVISPNPRDPNDAWQFGIWGPFGADPAIPGNIELFSQGTDTYAALLFPPASGFNSVAFGSLQIYKLTDPTNPVLVGHWGAENIPDGFRKTLLDHLGPDGGPEPLPSIAVADVAGFDDFVPSATSPVFGGDVGFFLDNELINIFNVFLGANAVAKWPVYGNDPGQTRSVSYIRISDDGKTAYVGMSDAGTAKLDLSDLSNIKIKAMARDSQSAGAQALGTISASYPETMKHGLVLLDNEGDSSPGTADVRVDSGSSSGTIYGGIEASYTLNVFNFDLGGPSEGVISGETKFIGVGCKPSVNGGSDSTATDCAGLDPVAAAFCNAQVPLADNPDQIAVVRRGFCAFSSKTVNALNAGYKAVILIQRQGEGGPIGQAGGFTPSYQTMIDYDSGLVVLAKAAGYELTIDDIGDTGETTSLVGKKAKFGGMRVWLNLFKSRPLIATINTACMADPSDADCQPNTAPIFGEKTVIGDKVYVPANGDGVLVLDMKYPRYPEIAAQWRPRGEPFETNNGGTGPLDNLYGNGTQLAINKVIVNEETNCIYAIDGTFGVYVLEEKGKKCKKSKNK